VNGHFVTLTSRAMNPRFSLFAPFFFLVAPLLAEQVVEQPATPPPTVVAQNYPAVSGPGMGGLDHAQSSGSAQKVYGPSADTLISRQTADGILENFRRVYKTDHAPRIVIYVNRALVDTDSGFKLTAHTEKYYTEDKSTKTSGENVYAVKDSPTPTLADQQTVREIERLFGRVFRNAGAQLADQQVAASLLPGQPGGHLAGERGAKDREALGNIADIAIEILISSRALTVPQVSGDVTLTVPDIQATAIRLKDAAIVGQAAASDILGKGIQAGHIAQQFTTADITEATAIALMSDMLTAAKN
jgi:hypothetical protein